MNSTKLHYLDPKQTVGSALDDDEVVLWSQSPSYAECRFYWRRKLGWWIFGWISVWTYVAVRQIDINASATAITIPIAFILVGIVTLLLIPAIIKLLSDRIYTITTRRVVISDARGYHLRFVDKKDIDGITYISGKEKRSGSVIITAGDVIGPDGTFSLKMRLIGISDLQLAREALTSKGL